MEANDEKQAAERNHLLKNELQDAKVNAIYKSKFFGRNVSVRQGGSMQRGKKKKKTCNRPAQRGEKVSYSLHKHPQIQRLIHSCV